VFTLLGGEKGANRSVRDFGWEVAHEAVSPRPPNSLDSIVARTEGYTYDAKVLDLCLIRDREWSSNETTILCRPFAKP
jgi:hypothetical protein